jgi:hypothetical protein
LDPVSGLTSSAKLYSQDFLSEEILKHYQLCIDNRLLLAFNGLQFVESPEARTTTLAKRVLFH